MGFKNLKIKNKLIISFGLVILLVVVLSVLSVVNLKNVNNTYNHLIASPISAKFSMSDFNNNAESMRRLISSIVMFAPNDDRSKIEDYYKDAMAVYDEGVKNLNAVENNPLFRVECIGCVCGNNAQAHSTAFRQ